MPPLRISAAVLPLLFLAGCAAPDIPRADRGGYLGGADLGGESAISPAVLNSHDDLARFIAGMPGPANSAMRAWRDESAWAGHRHRMDRLFERAEHGRLAEVAAWRRRAIGDLDGPVVFYPFGGPDFLYANAFFPGAQTYILCGLEGADPLPDLASLDAYRRNLCLDGTYNSIDTILSFSYFITKEMRVDLKATDLQGALPLILVFAARSGYRIDGIYPVQLGAGGEVAALSGWGGQNGILVAAIGPDGSRKQIYYFRYDLSDEGARDGRLFAFVRRQGAPVTFTKSASYLMHHDYFSRIRDFIRSESRGLVQDPSGVPYRLLAADPAWRITLFGNYVGATDPFEEYAQGDLIEACRTNSAGPLSFGVGYENVSRTASLIVGRHR